MKKSALVCGQIKPSFWSSNVKSGSAQLHTWPPWSLKPPTLRDSVTWPCTLMNVEKMDSITAFGEPSPCIISYIHIHMYILYIYVFIWDTRIWFGTLTKCIWISTNRHISVNYLQPGNCQWPHMSSKESWAMKQNYFNENNMEPQ